MAALSCAWGTRPLLLILLRACTCVAVPVQSWLFEGGCTRARFFLKACRAGARPGVCWRRGWARRNARRLVRNSLRPRLRDGLRRAIRRRQGLQGLEALRPAACARIRRAPQGRGQPRHGERIWSRCGSAAGDFYVLSSHVCEEQVSAAVAARELQLEGPSVWHLHCSVPVPTSWFPLVAFMRNLAGCSLSSGRAPTCSACGDRP